MRGENKNEGGAAAEEGPGSQIDKSRRIGTGRSACGMKPVMAVNCGILFSRTCFKGIRTVGLRNRSRARSDLRRKFRPSPSRHCYPWSLQRWSASQVHGGLRAPRARRTNRRTVISAFTTGCCDNPNNAFCSENSFSGQELCNERART